MALFGGKKVHSSALPSIWPTTPNSRFGPLDCVGESSHSQAIREVLGESPVLFGIAVLQPEPENKFDEKAIAVYVNARRVGYLSRATVTAHGKAIQKAINKQGHAVVEVMILGGQTNAQVILQPGNLGPIARPRLVYALLRASFKMKDGDKDWGFTVREESGHSVVFCSGATSALREEFVPKYALSLSEAGFQAKVVSKDGYPMVQVLP